MKAVLVLEDGTVVRGKGFGSYGKAAGELVFCTGMTGYTEALTDPSYKGQILMLTYPLIGNYGISSSDYESDGIKVEGFVVREFCTHPSSWRSEKSLDESLKEFGIPAISGVDTRALTRKARVYGTMKSILQTYRGKVDVEKLKEEARKQPHISEIDLVDKVSSSRIRRMEGEGKGEGKKEIVLIDCGYKRSILKSLLKRKVNVTLVPFDTSWKKILELSPDAVLISNGPGDPARVKVTINEIKKLVGKVPLYGICLGHQLISLALGAKTFKLKFGHRGLNQPVKDFETGRVFISTQNHGFAVEEESLPDGLTVTQINLNDRTIEGLKNEELRIRTVQYHPEASPGPHDTYFFFDSILEEIDAKEG